MAETTEQMQAELAQLKEAMDTVAQQFITATASQIAAQTMSMARSAGERQTEQTLALGEAGMTELHQSLAVIQEAMPETCESHLYLKTVFVHLGDLEEGYRFDPRNRKFGAFPSTVPEISFREMLAWPLSDCFEEIAQALTDKGFIVEGTRTDPFLGLYREFTWSSDMTEAMTTYSGQTTRYINLYYDLADAQSKQAREMWSAFQ